MKKTMLISLALLAAAAMAAYGAEQYDPSTISLEWDAPAGTVQGYRVKVGTQSGAYTESKETAGLTMALSAFTQKEGETYFAVVSAYNRSGEGPDSNEVSWIAGPSLPAAPALRLKVDKLSIEIVTPNPVEIK